MGTILEKASHGRFVIPTLSSLEDDKVLGPDGFLMKFYYEIWDVLPGDVMGTFGEFHKKATLYRSLNTSFIALIPKEKGCEGP